MLNFVKVGRPVGKVLGEEANLVATLRGVNGFCVGFDGSVPKQVHVDAIQMEFEARLRNSKIPLVDSETLDVNSDVVILSVQLNAHKVIPIKSGFYAVGVDVRAFQFVRLERSPSIRRIASTWETGIVTLASGDTVHEVCVTVCMKCADTFITAYQTANSSSDL